MGEETRTNTEKALMIISIVAVFVLVTAFLGTFTLGLGDQVQETPTAPPDTAQQTDDGLGVESGSLSVDSDDAQEDARELKGVLDRFGGVVEREVMEVRTGSVTHEVEVLVDRSLSVEFVDWVQENHDVRRADVRYETPTDDAGTDEEGDEGTPMSSVEVTFNEEREASLVPEEFTGEVRAEVGGSLESVSGNAAKLAAVPFEVVSILLAFLRLVAYLVAVGVPLFIGYVATQRLFGFDVADI